MSEQSAPVFTKPGISFEKLNRVSRAAFGEISVEGGDINHSGPDQVRITIPPIPERLIVRIVIEEGGSEFESGSRFEAAEKTAYSWVEQVPLSKGRWEDAPNPQTGDIDVSPAYEANGVEVNDGLIVELIPTIGYWDETTVPASWIQEWCFWATPDNGDNGSGDTGTPYNVECVDGQVIVTRA